MSVQPPGSLDGAVLGSVLCPNGTQAQRDAAALAFRCVSQDLGLGFVDLDFSSSSDSGVSNHDRAVRMKRQRRKGPKTDKNYYKKCAYGTYMEESEFEKTVDEHGVDGRKKFRKLFRIPWEAFLELEEALQARGRFVKKRQGRIPPRFKLWTALRIMGRGLSTNDDCEHSRMSERSVYRAFHEFVLAVSQELFDVYVRPPETEAEINKAVGMYSAAGADGVVGSLDCVHLPWGRCPAGLYNQCAGRYGHPTLGFEVAVSHDTRVLSCTQAAVGTISDKTVVKFDTFVSAIRAGKYRHVEFELFDRDGRPHKHRGLVLLTDGGYHMWVELQTAFGPSSCKVRRAWTAKVNSLRKDVECTFGIMKKRFRILKVPCELPEQADITALMRAACVLHNLVLKHDRREGTSHSRRSDVFEAEFDASFGDFEAAVIGTELEWAHDGGVVHLQADTDLTRVGTDRPLMPYQVEKDCDFDTRRKALADNHWYRCH